MRVTTPDDPSRWPARGELPPPLPPARASARARLRSTLWRLRLVVAALCLGAAAASVVHALRPPEAATVTLVVLARDVPAGTSLTTADVALAAVAPGAGPDGALTDVADVAGRVAAVDLAARLPLTPALLVGTTLAGPEGTVVVAVRLDDPGVAAMLEPGLHLDLVAAPLEGGDGRTVARRALVRSGPRAEAASDGLLVGTSPHDAPPVLVAVAPDEAVRIAEASVSSRLVAVVVP